MYSYLLDNQEFIIRLNAALLLGAAIGFERQWRQKSAGLRTNTLVSLGSAAYILLSVNINGIGGDPGRIAAQIVTGIGFLGAGVIMKDGLTIQGLNTAATIWCSAAVGSLAGMGLFSEAFMVTLAIIMTHLVLRPVSDKLARIKSYKKPKQEEAFYLLEIFCSVEIESDVRTFLIELLDSSDKYLLRSISRKDAENASKVYLSIRFSTVGRQERLLEETIKSLVQEMGVESINWSYTDHEFSYSKEA